MNTQKKTFKVTVILGEDGERYWMENSKYGNEDELEEMREELENITDVVDMEFDTIEERQAFCRGIDMATGWLGSAIIIRK